MGAMSKIISTNINAATCAAIFHPGQTCFEGFKQNIMNSMLSSMKFAGPMSLIPFLMKLKRCNKELVWDTFAYFVEFSVALYLVGNTITTTICLFRRIQGRFIKFTVGFLPAFLAGFWGAILSEKLHRFVSLSVTQIIIEASLKNKTNPVTRTLGGSKLLQTIIFMTCSACVLSAIEKHKYKMFWFVSPPSSGDSTNDKKINGKCKHEGLCMNYVFKGIRHYFLLAFALENIKTVVRKLGRINSVSAYIKSIDWNAIAFLVSYVGIYRLSYCLMNNWTQLDDEIVHPLSAFLGGFSYIFYAKSMLLAYSVSLMGEIGWNAVKKRKNTYPNVVQKIINLPYHKFYFSVVLGFVVHHYIFHNWMLSPIASQFINGATANKGDMCLRNAVEVLWEYQNSK